jgi:CheY-like chemotaxis protein
VSSAAGLPEDVLSSLAHELNTPISVIMGYAELLEKRSEEADTRRAATQIREAAERLRSTVARLLADEGAMTRPFVLIVDDDEVIRSLLRMTLPEEGFDLVEAEDGETALQLTNGPAPALVLLDWKMPGRSGAEVLPELKRRHPDTPVIVLTAEPESAHRKLAESLGADVFMTKPFSPLQLLSTVERLLPERPLDERA